MKASTLTLKTRDGLDLAVRRWDPETAPHRWTFVVVHGHGEHGGRYQFLAEWFAELWSHAIAESKKLADHYRRVAGECGVHFFDAGSVAKADPTDGGHLDTANTRAIGQALVPLVKKILDI